MLFNFSKITNLFSSDAKSEVKKTTNKRETIEDIFDSKDYSVDFKVNQLDLNTFEDPIIINSDKEKTLLILDDIEESDYLFNIDFRIIKEKYGYDIFKELKIVKCYGKQAGFIAKKYLSNPDNKVDYAILDITLGNSLKLADGSYIEYDGIDIGLQILEQNPEAIIRFLTAHTLNRRNPMMMEYFNKFESNTNKLIDDFYINKNGDRPNKYAVMLGILKEDQNGKD